MIKDHKQHRKHTWRTKQIQAVGFHPDAELTISLVKESLKCISLAFIHVLTVYNIGKYCELFLLGFPVFDNSFPISKKWHWCRLFLNLWHHSDSWYDDKIPGALDDGTDSGLMIYSFHFLFYLPPTSDTHGVNKNKEIGPNHVKIKAFVEISRFNRGSPVHRSTSPVKSLDISRRLWCAQKGAIGYIFAQLIHYGLLSLIKREWHGWFNEEIWFPNGNLFF